MHYASKPCWVTSMILRHKLVDSISVAVSPDYFNNGRLVVTAHAHRNA